jgi:hypothetical protein
MQGKQIVARAYSGVYEPRQSFSKAVATNEGGVLDMAIAYPLASYATRIA